MNMSSHSHRQISLLPESIAASIRASQVIGSFTQAIEELVHNSIFHGCAKLVVVTVGKSCVTNNRPGAGGGINGNRFCDDDSMSEIKVCDDGIGIDGEAMRKFIGTECCSIETDKNNASNTDTGHSLDGFDQVAGETLKSIAALCTEMKIETACWQPSNFNVEERDCHEGSNKRRRKSEDYFSASTRRGKVVNSVKVIKDGTVVSFNDSSGDSTPSIMLKPYSFAQASKSESSKRAASSYSDTTTGTTITIRGLFHRHAVRKKQLRIDKNRQGKNGSSTNSESASFSPIRASLRMLALSYPLVTFKLKNGVTGKIDCSFIAPIWTGKFGSVPLTCRSSLAASATSSASPNLRDESRALVERLCEVYQTEFSKEKCVELTYDESKSPIDTSTRTKHHKRGFQAFGVICIQDNDDRSPLCRGLEMIVINGKMATRGNRLSEVVQSQIMKCKGNKAICSMGRFLIHILCSNSDSQMVVSDGKATVAVPQKDRLERCLKEMVSRAVSRKGALITRAPDEAIKHAQSSCNLRGLRAKRIVKGQSVSSTRVTAAKSNVKPLPEPKSSPFSEVFFDAPKQRTKKAAPAINQQSAEPLNGISFKDAFFNDSPPTKMDNSDEDEFDDVMDDNTALPAVWTKKRMTSLQTTIATLTHEASGGPSQEQISLTKDMLSKAEVIAQVEEKFIMIKACGVICVVDQHAADERVALEKLETHLFHPHMHDGMKISMTKKQLMVSDILKTSKVIPSKRIPLTMSQMATVRHHHVLLQKWKFEFEELPLDEKSIILTSVPSVCGRIAEVNDFLDFVKELSHVTGGEIKPDFVKRILASQACRYAIMFGDTLTHEQCTELIQSLSKCEFCFICAHGRPSVIPLIDMSRNNVSGLATENIPGNFQNTKQKESSLSFGPKRVIRQRVVEFAVLDESKLN